MTPRSTLRSLAAGDGPLPHAADLVAVWALVAGGGMLGFELAVPTSGVSTLWPPAGIVLGILLVAPVRHWGPLALAAALGGMTADGVFGARGWIVLTAALANVGESVCAAATVRWLIRDRVHLGSLRQIGLFVVGGTVASNAVTAAVGALILGRGLATDFGRNWLVWFIGDGLGMLVFAPLTVRVLQWLRSGAAAGRSAIEAALLVVVLVPIAVAVLRFSDSGVSWVPVYVLFPLLVWAGVRHGVLAASVASAVLTVTLLATLSHTPTLFAGAGAPRLHQEIEIYLFILIGTVSALTPAALIEERGAMDRQLRVSERRFLDLANSIHEAFFVVDVDQRTVTYANSAANVLLATAPGAPFDAAAWLAEVHPDDRRVVQAQAAALQRGHVAHATVRIPGHDTAWRWLYLRAYPVAADDSGTRCISCVAADVTALRHAEEQLRHAQKMEAVGQFASGIAHDFNNVLTVTMVAAEALENVLPADSEARPEVAAIRGASDRAAQLTRQLLRFSRREPAARSLVPLHTLLREMMPLLSRLVGRDIECALQLDADTDLVFADPTDLELVLFNLGKNAADAMPGGGALSISTARTVMGAGGPGGAGGAGCAAIALSVQDTGTGIEPDTMARIFEPFYTTKAREHGTGLGLATVQRIVQQHGGQVTVTSAPRQGTTFVVTLPLAAPADAADDGPATP